MLSKPSLEKHSKDWGRGRLPLTRLSSCLIVTINLTLDGWRTCWSLCRDKCMWENCSFSESWNSFSFLIFLLKAWSGTDLTWFAKLSFVLGMRGSTLQQRRGHLHPQQTLYPPFRALCSEQSSHGLFYPLLLPIGSKLVTSGSSSCSLLLLIGPKLGYKEAVGIWLTAAHCWLKWGECKQEGPCRIWLCTSYSQP